MRDGERVPRGRLEVRVSGVVQGVGFRYSASDAARRLSGVKGYVRNLADGSVEVVAEGPLPSLKRLEAWLKKGPPGAHVRHLEARYSEYGGVYRSFTIEF